MVKKFATFALASIALLAFSACQPPAPDYSAQLSPVLNAFVEVWNTGNVDGLDAIVAANYKRHAPTSTASANSLEELKGVVTAFRTAYPDLKVTIDEAHYQENLSFARWTFTGTNTGAGEAPPTGKSVNVSGASLARYDGGKLTEEFVYFDNLSFMTQLGYTLTPPAAPETAGQ